MVFLRTANRLLQKTLLFSHFKAFYGQTEQDVSLKAKYPTGHTYSHTYVVKLKV